MEHGGRFRRVRGRERKWLLGGWRGSDGGHGTSVVVASLLGVKVRLGRWGRRRGEGGEEGTRGVGDPKVGEEGGGHGGGVGGREGWRDHLRGEQLRLLLGSGCGLGEGGGVGGGWEGC